MIGVFFKRIDGEITSFKEICQIVLYRLVKLEKENYLQCINNRPSVAKSESKEINQAQEAIVEENADCLGSW